MDAQNVARQVIDNVEKVIVGKRDAIQSAVICLLCEGHLLIEDVPGVGKTMLAKSLARSIGCTFKRIQFTPDLLPSDVTGVSVFNEKTREFEYRPGPILSQIVLTDEINRATPKTQSALLEAMEERQVTVDGISYPTPAPFLVMATQNPIEYEGTFPLPEAQLDRFMMRVHLGHPAPADEIKILAAQQYAHPIEGIGQVIDAEELRAAQQEVKKAYVDQLVKEYIVDLVNASRRHPDVYLGASPRGSLALFKAAQARAILEGRDYTTPDDVKALALETLAHRLIIGPAARIKDVDQSAIVQELLRSVPVPGTRARAERA
ncbi:MAG: ATPase RavA [Chloroflexi bacterium ADurb.Bin180]|nr:MAG: ATPase RavA [Chloroflexi bacterium ADurb.Bin180]